MTVQIEVNLFANFRDEAGQKVLERGYDDGVTVGEVIADLEAAYPGIDILDEGGAIREFVNVFRNGRDVSYLEGLSTRLDDGDRLSVFPPIAGG